jgi:hypothetical protein
MPKVNWKKEKVEKVAKRFSTLASFKINAKSAYNAAIVNNWLDDIIGHMKPNRQKWTKERIIELAKQFNTISDFRRNKESAYVTAKAKGWLNEVTSHMIPLNIRWTDEMIIEEAKKYKTRREFEVKSPSACNIARSRKILEIACAHMERVGNYTKRLVYAYEFPDNTVYIGLTYNKLKRHNDHINKSKSAVYKKINQLNFIPIMKMISESYIDAEEARKLEEETINYYINKGWQILNTAKAGGLGGTKNIAKVIFKDKESCHIEALKYSSKKEFRENSLLAYRRAYDLHCLEEVCSHMRVKSIPFEDCKKEALKYSRATDFVKNSPKHYHRAFRMGWIDTICSHMRKISKGWNEELILIEAKKYSTIKEFRKNSSGAYEYARKKNLLKSSCLHMKPLLTKWTKEMVLSEVSKYSTHLDFRIKSPNAYDAARKNGWFSEIKPLLKYGGKN